MNHEPQPLKKLMSPPSFFSSLPHPIVLFLTASSHRPIMLILHKDPPSDSIPWDLWMRNPDTFLIDASTCVGPENRELLLAFAINYDVTFFTGIHTSDYYSPCGCTGYDNLCDYHYHSNEYDVAECFCSQKYKTVCSYHKGI